LAIVGKTHVRSPPISAESATTGERQPMATAILAPVLLDRPTQLSQPAEAEIAALLRQHLTGPAIAHRVGRPLSTVEAVKQIGCAERGRDRGAGDENLASA
jgi:hypothetical protein